jgi:hypothetical protein
MADITKTPSSIPIQPPCGQRRRHEHSDRTDNRLQFAIRLMFPRCGTGAARVA